MLRKYLITILIALIITGGIWWGWKNLPTKKVMTDEELVQRVSQLIVLPDEVATVATVTDKDKLGEMQFFKLAINGDRVLLFPKAAKAILYRPTTDKIIEVMTITSPIELPINSPTPPPTTMAKNIKVAVYNGSGKVGMAVDLADNVLAKIDTFDVVKKIDARGVYPKTVVVDIGGSSSDIAKTLAEEMGGEVKTLPDGEVKPNADILVIVGQNYMK